MDYSTLHHDQTVIVQQFHEAFDEANGGQSVERGEGRDVAFLFEGNEYHARLNNVDRSGYSDTYKLTWHDDLGELLRRRCRDSYRYLVAEHDEGKEPAYSDLPRENWSFIEFHATGEPFRYQLALDLGHFDTEGAPEDAPTAAQQDTAREHQEETLQELEDQLAAGDYHAPDTWSRSKTRQGQKKWSRQVLENFGHECAVCRIGIDSLLDAAHIHDWADDEENRLNPRNGIALCTLHHRAEARGLLEIVDGRVRVSEEHRDVSEGPVYEYLSKYHGEEIKEPRVWELFGPVGSS